MGFLYLCCKATFNVFLFCNTTTQNMSDILFQILRVVEVRMYSKLVMYDSVLQSIIFKVFI